MASSLTVLPEVENVLRSAKGPGLLVGLEGDHGIIVIGAIATKHAAGDVQELLPIPLAVAGSFDRAGAAKTPSPTLGLVAAEIDDKGSITWRWLATAGRGDLLPHVQTAASDWREEWVAVRATASASLTYVRGQEASKATLAALGGVGSQLASAETLYLTPDASQSLADMPSLREGAPQASWDSPLHVMAYPCLTSERPAFAPVVITPQHKVKPGAEIHTARLHLDALCYVRRDTPGALAAYNAVRQSILEQIAGVSLLLSRGEQAAGAATIQAYHFLPPGFQHHVSLLYPLAASARKAEEAALAERRAAIHAMLGLPSDRPLLRIARAVPIEAPGAMLPAPSTRRLADVHVGIAPSRVKGGTQHLVQGSYLYYHYMQDRFNDSGWGCAYRSLQTLWSWFLEAGYTSTPPPDHAAIQTMLVMLGDKEPSFRGSKQWIGAVELGFVLDEGLGVQCKVLPLASGADLPDKAAELAHHFDTQGTPVMVGGGVLAYTLLGVDWNESTGEVAFLILDPHYTGGEDLKKIHAGQWVAWKQYGDKAAAGGKLLHADAFYNILCPQRPLGV
uniref:Ufm1-specific protease n=1 Tax=Auxenochlorella protothecoides TaxID=3075 RepID=A0A1D2AB68_AUXPR